MKIDSQGWFEGVKQLRSSYFRPRQANTSIDLLVIHNISLPPGQFGTGDIERLFTGQLDCTKDQYYEQLVGLTVCAHLLVSRTGEVTQFVSLQDAAWHAGASSFEGRTDCNDFSIGIELEGCDDQPFEPIQYEQLARLTVAIQRRYPRIVGEHIVGHSTIAPGRKTDPGPFFQWDLFRQTVQLLYNEMSVDHDEG